jgi:hypothetical protein
VVLAHELCSVVTSVCVFMELTESTPAEGAVCVNT